ncbi:hypothetical protein Gotur_010575 [Gossypium turneri]
MEDGLPKVSWRDKLVGNVKDMGLEDEVLVESELEIGEDEYRRRVVDLDNNFFLVKLTNQKDYDNALMGGS